VLPVLHGPHRPDRHPPQAPGAAGPVRPHPHRDERDGRPQPGRADVLRRRGGRGQLRTGRDRHDGGRAARRGAPRGGLRRRSRLARRRPDRLRRPDRPQQDRLGRPGAGGRGRGADQGPQRDRRHHQVPLRRRGRGRRPGDRVVQRGEQERGGSRPDGRGRAPARPDARLGRARPRGRRGPGRGRVLGRGAAAGPRRGRLPDQGAPLRRRRPPPLRPAGRAQHVRDHARHAVGRRPAQHPGGADRPEPGPRRTRPRPALLHRRRGVPVPR